MVAFDIRHILAAVVAIADMDPKLALVLLLIWACPFVELEANEAPVCQLRRAVLGQIVKHLLDALTFWVRLVVVKLPLGGPAW